MSNRRPVAKARRLLDRQDRQPFRREYNSLFLEAEQILSGVDVKNLARFHMEERACL